MRGYRRASVVHHTAKLEQLHKSKPPGDSHATSGAAGTGQLVGQPFRAMSSEEFDEKLDKVLASGGWTGGPYISDEEINQVTADVEEAMKAESVEEAGQDPGV